MGYRHSSAQLSGHSGLSSADRRAAASASPGTFPPCRTAPAQRIRAQSFPTYTLLFLMRCYMIFFSPFFGGACKFQPSCSNYAYEAILRHGVRRGALLAMKRLLRCRPFTVGGFDPVPESDVPSARQTAGPHTWREPVQ